MNCFIVAESCCADNQAIGFTELLLSSIDRAQNLEISLPNTQFTNQYVGMSNLFLQETDLAKYAPSKLTMQLFHSRHRPKIVKSPTNFRVCHYSVSL